MTDQALRTGAHSRERPALRELPRPSYRGLLWALPLFAAEWLFVPLLPSEGAAAAALALAALLAYVVFVHLHERRDVRELRGGLPAVTQAALGAGLGLVVPLGLLAFYLGAQLTSIAGLYGWPSFSLTLGAVGFAAAIAVFEELLFRGLVLRYLELRLGSWPALALSAVLFGAYHYIGSPQTPLMFAERVLAGLLFGAAYLLTRRLWASIGLHCGLNVGLALVFGGSDVIALLRLIPEGDPYWTTGGGAPLLRLALVGLLACVALVAAQRSGRMVSSRQAWALQSDGHEGEGNATADV
jgi:CAAX protease family protein